MKKRRKKEEISELSLFEWVESYPPTSPVEKTEEEFSHDRMVQEMLSALRHLDQIDEDKVRLTAIVAATQASGGIQLDGHYTLPILPDRQLDGYQFAAYYYCSFTRAFPSMTGKIAFPYVDCYNEALQMNVHHT